MATKSDKKKTSRKPAKKEAAKKTITQKKAAPKKPTPPKVKEVKSRNKATKLKKMPKPAELEKMKKDDADFIEAQENPIKFLEGRRQAIYNIARYYHLDVEELYQEGYEVLLTCLRDFSPVFERKNGDLVKVKFTTFFGNRIETRGMEMRNRDPEYQARQAYTEKMEDSERDRFRADPPLLVQHLDHDSAMQEMLTSEASLARLEMQDDISYKVVRDSFFERKLSELIANEKDEKKKAALLHVKVGGVYNFQEIAYHFGVTDSRASQVMNELMDAFYVQRLIDGNLQSVAHDFEKLKFNDKRIKRLLLDALKNAPEERQKEILELFGPTYKELPKAHKEQQAKITKKEDAKEARAKKPKQGSLPPYEDVLSERENRKWPLESIDVRPLEKLKFMDVDFRAPEEPEEFEAFVELFDPESSSHPAVVTEQGWVLDGVKRIRAAQIQGKDDFLCITRKVKNEEDAKMLRVMINMRTHKPTKLDLYYAISALAELGFSQQKIADCLGTSRTNVLVYVKVRDKARPKVRALFEDELIQITNASMCADLDDEKQDKVADFIRKYGLKWSKGTKFNELMESVEKGKLAQLEKKLKPDPIEPKEPATKPVESSSQVTSQEVQLLQKQLATLQHAVKDNEVWQAQREKVIVSQTEELEEAKGEIEALKRELEAAELMRYGSKDAVEAELKELKKYYAVTERIGGALSAIAGAASDMRSLRSLTRKQTHEIQALVEDLEKNINRLRVEVLNQNPQQGKKQEQKSANA